MLQEPGMFPQQKCLILSVYFTGLDQSLEDYNTKETLIAIPLKCEWNPFIVGALLFVLNIL